MHESVHDCSRDLSVTSTKLPLCDLSLFGHSDIPITSINIIMTQNVKQKKENSSMSGQDSGQANKCFYSMKILITQT